MSTCLRVIAGRHPSSSFKMDKQIVPDGYTLGWKRGGTNLPVEKGKTGNKKNENRLYEGGERAVGSSKINRQKSQACDFFGINDC